MAFTYSNIRFSAYQPAPGADSVQSPYLAMPFPDQAHRQVLTLFNLGRNKDAEPYRTAPTRRLDNFIQGLVADLVVMRRRAGQSSPDDRWLYQPVDSGQALPDEILLRLLSVWLSDVRPEPEHRETLIEVLAGLKSELPQWFPTPVRLLDFTRTTGGTASPEDRQYALVADHFARRVQALPPYDFGTGKLYFRAVAREAYDQGAELMSQPLEYREDGRTWWYSVTINLSLHTVPFFPLPRLHLYTGIRRWATRVNAGSGRVRLAGGRNTSVYLRPVVPWVPGTPLSERFTVAKVRWDRDLRKHCWRDGEAGGMFERVSLGRPFPDVGDLLVEPEKWLLDGPGPRAAVVHSNHMGKHGVAVGLMSHQRSQIAEWAEQALFPELVRVPDPARSLVAGDSPLNARPKPTPIPKKRDDVVAVAAAEKRRAAEDEQAAKVRRVALARTCAPGEPAETPVLEARLLWQTTEWRDASTAALAAELGLPDSDEELHADAYESAAPGRPATLVWRTRELVVRLRCLKLVDGLAESFRLSPESRHKARDLAEAIRGRRTAIGKFLTTDGASTAFPTLALVEINGKADFDQLVDDPKFALRLGCADAGVVTQFAVVPKTAATAKSRKELAHRVRSSWQDGFRQLGVRAIPRHALGDRLPADLQYLAVWVVKRRKDSRTGLPRRFPVAVLLRADDGSAGDSVRGWDPQARGGVGDWVPYARFLLRLSVLAEVKEKDLDEREGRPSWTWPVRRRSEEDRRLKTARFLQKVLYSKEVRSRSTVLLAEAQNIREDWPWMQDGVVVKDLIRTGRAPAIGLNLNPWLRLVRVRSADHRETSQWWGVGNPAEVNGLSAGFWVPGEEAHGGSPPQSGRVFYSTTAKPLTFKDSAVAADKLTTRPLRAGERKGMPTIDTGIPAWNPRLVEIAVLGCQPEQGDDPLAFAFAVHQQRQAPDYSDALSLPLPLHLASLGSEYVLPTRSDDEESEDPEDED